MLSEREILFANEHNVYREEEEGAFLFDPDDGKLKFLNGTGREVYNLCDGNRTIGEIIDLVASFYEEVPKERIVEDTMAFFRTLLTMKFLLRKEHGV